MNNDWNEEFAQVRKHLGELDQKTKERKELEKDPKAYFEKMKKKSVKKQMKAGRQVQFMLPDI